VDADPQALKDAVLRIRKAIRSVEGAYGTFIGGLAVQNLGYERWTDDVDVVVDAEHFSQVLDILRADGFNLEVDLSLKHKTNGAKIDFRKEGVKLKNSRFPLPHPSELGPNMGFATISSVVMLKLDSRRRQDLADIVTILKRRKAEIPSVREKLPEVMKAEFDQLAAEAVSDTEN